MLVLFSGFPSPYTVNGFRLKAGEYLGKFSEELFQGGVVNILVVEEMGDEDSELSGMTNPFNLVLLLPLSKPLELKDLLDGLVSFLPISMRLWERPLPKLDTLWIKFWVRPEF